MSGKPAARLGDPTQCPQTGHGARAIASGAPNVLFNGKPAARLVTAPPAAAHWPARSSPTS